MGPTGFKGFQYDNGLMWDDWESLQLLSLAESACSQISGATPLWRMVWSISKKNMFSLLYRSVKSHQMIPPNFGAVMP